MGENKNNKFAYFREFTRSNQFELLFDIDTKVPSLGVFKEEIKAVRATDDTVSSLLQHIQNKILKILKDKYVEKEDKEQFCKNFKIPISLTKGKRCFEENMGLKAFCNHLKDEFTIFEIFDQQYIVLPNAPLIKQVKLPPIMYTNSCIQPSKYSTLFTEKDLSMFIWYKSKDKVKWIKVGKEFGYTTKDEDVGYYLKVLCKPVNHKGVHGPSVEAVSDSVVEIMEDLPSCPFEIRHQYTKEKLTDNNE